LTEADVLEARPVAVISEDMAKRVFADGNPLGRHFQVNLFNQPIPAQIVKSPQFHHSFEIVGVVASARNRGLTDPPRRPFSFLIRSWCRPTRSSLRGPKETPTR